MRWREPPIGVVLSELPRVLAEAADRAHVLPLHRDWVARLEAVPDANPKDRLRPRGGLARLPRPQLHPRSRWDRHQVADLDRVLDRLFLGLAPVARACGIYGMARTAPFRRGSRVHPRASISVGWRLR